MSHFPSKRSAAWPTRRMGWRQSVASINLAPLALFLCSAAVAQAEVEKKSAAKHAASVVSTAEPTAKPSDSEPAVAPTYPIPQAPTDQPAPPESKRRADPITNPSTPTEIRQVLPRLASGQAFPERVGFYFRATSGPTFLHIGKMTNALAQFAGYNGTAAGLAVELGGAVLPGVVFGGQLAGDFLLSTRHLTLTPAYGGVAQSGQPVTLRFAGEFVWFPSRNSGLNVDLDLGVMAMMNLTSNSSSSSSSSDTVPAAYFAGLGGGYDWNIHPRFSVTIRGQVGTTVVPLHVESPLDAVWVGLRVGMTAF